MTLHHPPGRYGPAKSWITSFVVPDDGPSSSSSQDGQRTHTGDIPQIFERQRSVNLTGITGLTLFYGFDRQHHRGLLCELGDVRGHTTRVPHADLYSDSLHMGECRWVYVPIAPGDQITDLGILNTLTTRRYAVPSSLFRVPLVLNFPCVYTRSLTHSPDSHKARRCHLGRMAARRPNTPLNDPTASRGQCELQHQSHHADLS